MSQTVTPFRARPPSMHELPGAADPVECPETYTLDGLLQRSLIVCCGSGGVGKTTLAAALGLEAARRGRRVLVLTIDPARRLATALGLTGIGNDETPIPRALLQKAGVPEAGALSALMLDARRTFDGMVGRLAPSAEIRDRILANRYYQQISGAMVGTHEYMAMERLLSVYEASTYDLIVLDTPPSRHALDFLTAPARLQRVLEEGVIKWLLQPTTSLANRFSQRLSGSLESGMLGSLERILGLSMLGELSEFVQHFQSLLGGMKARAARAEALLAGRCSAFVLVTAPARLSIEEAAFFRQQLQAQGLPFAGFIVNRAQPVALLGVLGEQLLALQDAPVDRWSALLPCPREVTPAEHEAMLQQLRAWGTEIFTRLRADRAQLSWLRSQGGDESLFLTLPEMPEDIHDLEGLLALAEQLRRAALNPEASA